MDTLAKRMVIRSDLKAARDVEDAVVAEVRRCGFSESTAFAVKLAMEEGINNAIRHGNGYDPNKTVEVAYEIDAGKVVIVVTDQGQGFDPAGVPDPTIDENIEKPSGRGIMLMRRYMDEVCFNERGNQVRMVKWNG